MQVILEHGGDVRFNYLKVTANATSSTVGIQGDDGSWNWYQEYVYNADPLKHVPADSTSVLFRAPGVGVEEQHGIVASLPALQVPTICRGPVRITVGAEVRSLQVFDASGRLVRILAANSSLLTANSVVWDRRDSHGRPVPEGAYFLRAASSQGSLTSKLLLLD